MKLLKKYRKHFVPKVGMKVKIRSWDDMAEEFGMYDSELILCNRGFTRAMRSYCGEILTCVRVTPIHDLYVQGCDKYVFSADMIDEIVEGEVEIPMTEEIRGVFVPVIGMKVKVRQWDDCKPELPPQRAIIGKDEQGRYVTISGVRWDNFNPNVVPKYKPFPDDQRPDLELGEEIILKSDGSADVVRMIDLDGTFSTFVNLRKLDGWLNNKMLFDDYKKKNGDPIGVKS